MSNALPTDASTHRVSILQSHLPLYESHSNDMISQSIPVEVPHSDGVVDISRPLSSDPTQSSIDQGTSTTVASDPGTSVVVAPNPVISGLACILRRSIRTSKTPSYLKDYHCAFLNGDTLPLWFTKHALHNHVSYSKLSPSHYSLAVGISSIEEPQFYHQVVCYQH